MRRTLPSGGESRRGWDSNRAKSLLSITCGNCETLMVTETLKSPRVGAIQERCISPTRRVRSELIARESVLAAE